MGQINIVGAGCWGRYYIIFYSIYANYVSIM